MNQHNPKTTIRNVAILASTFKNPDNVAPQIRPLRFAAVLSPLAKEVFIIAGNFRAKIPYGNVTVINVKAPIIKTPKGSLISRGLRFLLAQFTLSSAIVRLFSKVGGNLDIVFFFGGVTSLIPMIVSKLLRRKVVLLLRGLPDREMQIARNPFHELVACLKRINLALSDEIIVGSARLISEWKLEKQRNKIVVAPYCDSALFADSNRFIPTKPLVERANTVGYIGRLRPEKGILNFIQAMPMLLRTRNDIRALILGDGQLQDEVAQYLKQEKLDDRVTFVGWVANDDVPDYLNKLRLLVLPSYTEGLPNVVLEAMACGTPVLATPVGSIPEVIKDGENGFIMEDNSPECIARNVSRALSQANLDEISRNARAFVEGQYSYEAAVERYRDILTSLKAQKHVEAPGAAL